MGEATVWRDRAAFAEQTRKIPPEKVIPRPRGQNEASRAYSPRRQELRQMSSRETFLR